MATYILANHMMYQGERLKAGKILDDTSYNIAHLQANGAVLVATPNTIVETRAAFVRGQQAKGRSEGEQDLLTAAQAESGGGGGGGVTSVTGTAPIASSGGATPAISIVAASGSNAGSMASADFTKLAGIGAGAAVVSVAGSAPIASSGGASPTISIAAASGSVAGSMSSGDFTKLSGIAAGASVSSVSGTAPIVSSGGATPAISISAATGATPGSMSSADKTRFDAIPDFGSGTIITTDYVRLGPTPRTTDTTAAVQLTASEPLNVISKRSSGNTTDYNVLTVGAGGFISLGNLNWSNANIQCYLGGYVGISNGSNYNILTQNQMNNMVAPMGGWAGVSVPMTVMAKSVALPDADYTLTGSDYEKPSLQFTGTLTLPRNVVCPAGTSTKSPFFMVTNGASLALTFGVTAGTGVTVAAGQNRLIFYNGTNYVGA